MGRKPNPEATAWRKSHQHMSFYVEPLLGLGLNVLAQERGLRMAAFLRQVAEGLVANSAAAQRVMQGLPAPLLKKGHTPAPLANLIDEAGAALARLPVVDPFWGSGHPAIPDPTRIPPASHSCSTRDIPAPSPRTVPILDDTSTYMPRLPRFAAVPTRGRLPQVPPEPPVDS